MEKVIKIKDLSYDIYDNKILKNINFNFNGGKFYSIIGPNGSGKTTILKHISKSIPETTGAIYINGEELYHMPIKNLAREISLVPQNTNITFNLQVEDIVMMGRSRHISRFKSPDTIDKKKAYEAMNLTNTLHLRKRNINELSGGERQRVIIARAICQESNMILLDEPISNLDIFHQVEILNIIKRLNKEKNTTIIAVLHDINIAIEYSDEIVIMKDGEILDFGTIEKVINASNIKKVYGIEVNIVENPKSRKPHIIPII